MSDYLLINIPFSIFFLCVTSCFLVYNSVIAMSQSCSKKTLPEDAHDKRTTKDNLIHNVLSYKQLNIFILMRNFSTSYIIHHNLARNHQSPSWL